MSPKPWQDWVYLGIIVAQLAGMLLLDFVVFYPSWLHATPSSPLYFLTTLRRFYTHHSGDPYTAAPAASPAAFPFFEALAFVELAAQFPLALYLVPRLWRARSGTDGRTELAALTFACLTAMGATVCCFDVWHMSEAVLARDAKLRLLATEFGPYAVVPAAMAVDMYTRLLRRVDAAEAKAKAQ